MMECKEKKHDNTIAIVMTVVGIVAVVAGVAFAVYKFITKRKEAKELLELDDYAVDEDSVIELEFAYPEEEHAATDAATKEEE